jgi:hypothetical protein
MRIKYRHIGIIRWSRKKFETTIRCEISNLIKIFPGAVVQRDNLINLLFMPQHTKLVRNFFILNSYLKRFTPYDFFLFIELIYNYGQQLFALRVSFCFNKVNNQTVDIFNRSVNIVKHAIPDNISVVNFYTDAPLVDEKLFISVEVPFAPVIKVIDTLDEY